jgi:hypothetical protein
MSNVQEVGRGWAIYDAVSAVEGFGGYEHSEEELLSAWQHLVDTGVVWQLQGRFGRTAVSLIEAGLIQPAEE